MYGNAEDRDRVLKMLVFLSTKQHRMVPHLCHDWMCQLFLFYPNMYGMLKHIEHLCVSVKDSYDEMLYLASSLLVLNK